MCWVLAPEMGLFVDRKTRADSSANLNFFQKNHP